MAEDRTSGQDEKRPLEKELAELRREVLESRNLVIKTDNLLKNLFAELKSVAKKNDDQYRRTWFASAAAYLVFLGMALAVGVLGARASNAGERARVESAQGEADLAKKRADDLAAQLAKAQQDTQASRAATDRAVTIYKLLTEAEGEARLKGVDELAKLDRARLNVLEQKALDEKVKVAKVEIGQVAFDKGKAAHRREDWRTAGAELKRYLALSPDGADAVQASYLAGTALYNLKDWTGCVPFLERFTVQGRGQKGADYAFLLLGQALEALNQPEKAVDAYKKGVIDYPGSELVPVMQQRFRVAQQAVLRGQGGTAASPTSPAPGPAAAAAPLSQPVPTATTGRPALPVQPAQPAPAPAPKPPTNP
ncbi:MAG TPA: hypothetical protein VGK67_18945 [Myxococcales bacterium]|jgi:TolA-binding protein